MATIDQSSFKDAYVDLNNSGTNYGTADPLLVAYNTGVEKDVLIGWDKGFFDGITVTSVVMYIYIDVWDGVSSHDFRVKRVTGTWTEGGVTYATRPSTTSTNAATFQLSGIGWKSVDITNMWNDEGTSTFSAWIEGLTLTSSCSISAREGDNGPYLHVTYTNPSAIRVDSVSGSDLNSGVLCTAPKQTFGACYDMIATNGTIYVCNSGADFSGETITFTKGFSATTNNSTGNFFLPKFQ